MLGRRADAGLAGFLYIVTTEVRRYPPGVVGHALQPSLRGHAHAGLRHAQIMRDRRFDGVVPVVFGPVPQAPRERADSFLAGQVDSRFQTRANLCA